MSARKDTSAKPSRLLLHACCGPCLIEPLDALAAEAEHVTIAFANPNIHPAEEYVRRLETLRGYAERAGVDVIELPHDPGLWFDAVAPLANSGTARCRACYRLRLDAVARHAASNGFEAIATTLTVSPYQDSDAIRTEGEHSAAAAGVSYLHRDFRDRYPEATRRSRELGMYRQNYCGCVLSDVEAQRQRAKRKAARIAEKLVKRRANESGGQDT